MTPHRPRSLHSRSSRRGSPGRRTLILAATASLLALTACGDDDGSPGATVAPGPAVTFATTSVPSTGGTSTGGSDASSTTAAPVTSATATTTVPLGDPVVALAPFETTFDQPVDVAVRPGDPAAYVVERTGRVVPLRDGEAGAAVLDITDLTEGEGERGLLGVAFTADGSTAYVNHTDNGGDTVIAEYAVAADGTFDASSRRVVLTVEQPYANHNGGGVVIGPDGMLYIGMGDGGAADDPERRSLDVSSLLGKMLRIDPRPAGDQPYSIPADNPFVDVPGARGEIWSVGLRNPWRFSFDAPTGDLWIADVGQNEVEEIDVAWAADGAGRGFNFGWSAFEGTRRFNEDQPADGAIPPIHEYEHGDRGCSVSGGARSRGAAIPELAGWYVYGDYCSGELWGLEIVDRGLGRVLPLAQQPEVVAVRVGPDGELWVVSIGGQIARIVPG
ncbi:MAG: PQQ-dependent sugar dehydrogenase [Acidimicrobiaceae bacterium]|nr:PQQ-dependent sugar dehydrogenase [Acidimicrobiaceae bacterium]